VSQTAVASEEAVRPPRPVRGGAVALGVVALAWAAFVALYLDHGIVLSPDSMNNYAHVWWIADRLWGHGSLPLHMPVLGHGQAFTFPYGLPNWTAGALLRPVLGDWAVTLSSVLGAAGCAAATFFAFPELRRGWWAAAALANPAIFQALLLGQQSFAWAGALLLFGIGCWRRDQRLAAAVLIGVAQATHPAVVLPTVAILVVLRLRYDPARGALVRWYAVSVAIAAPAALAVLTSPAYADSTLADKVFNFFSTLAPRILLPLLPIAFALMARTGRRALAPTALAISLVLNVALARPVGVEPAWRQMNRTPAANTSSLRTFLASDAFRPGSTYRVLRAAWDAKLGLYLMLRAGGHLDSEFFPESMAIRSFGTSANYEHLLCHRRVDYVLAFNGYFRAYRTDEQQLLRSLAAGGRAGLVRVHPQAVGPDYTVYAVDRSGCPR